jgi:glucosamine--fructose-6-phosphate aminotransferase (isomerizing)
MSTEANGHDRVGKPGGLMGTEIAQQPDVLRALLADGAEIADAATRISRFSPRFVVLAARGTSDHAALYGKYLAEIRLGLPAGLASPSSMTVYGSRPDLSDVLFVAVSQSGASPDLMDSTAAAHACGALTVAVTNSPGSPLAEQAEIHVDVRAGVERAVAATKTYTAELLALYLLLSGTPDAAAGIGDAAERTLRAGAGQSAAHRYLETNRVVVTARGFSYPTAREAALKLMETSYLSAHAFSGADLLHGPLAMVDEHVPVIAVVTPGRGAEAMQPVLDRVRSSGSDLLLVGSDDGLPVASAGLPEELFPVIEILPLQQLACELATLRGSDPDRPRGLAKVTQTW